MTAVLEPPTRTAAPPGRPPRRRRAPRDWRGRIGFAVLLALLAAVAGRLVQVQVLDAAPYAAAAADQRLRTVATPAVRGAVLDRHGVPLAQDVEGRRVVADPTLVDDPVAIARVLSPLLDRSVQELSGELQGPGRYVVLARGLDPEQGARVDAAEQAGVFVRAEQVRDRPDGALAAAVVGYTGTDDDGLAGVEARLDDVLAGTAGSERYEVDGDGRRIPQGFSSATPSRPGRDVVLTLDRDLQYVVERALRQRLEDTEAASGSVVVTDPRTGEVLALAMAPGFDADAWRDYPAGRRTAPAVSDVYEPGSVQKVITAAAALEAGVVTPQEVLDLPPSLSIGTATVRDDHPLLGEHTFAQVIAASSNVGTVTVAERLGRERLRDAMVDFGLGDRTGIGLPGESRGVLPLAEDRSRAADATVPIGYGVSVTAVQVAQVMATVANGGVRVPPRVVLGEREADGTFRAAPRPDATRVVSERTAEELTEMLEGVVGAEGTAPLAAVPGYPVAGKTGTALRLDPDTGRYSSEAGYVASFAGFAPADDPQLVISVVVQDPRGGEHVGGVVSGPLFAEIASYALGREGVAPRPGEGRVAPGAGDGSSRSGGVPDTLVPASAG